MEATISTLAKSTEQLTDAERRHYRDLLRGGRYAALADAEGFEQICFVLEDLGRRLLGRQQGMAAYSSELAVLAEDSHVLSVLSQAHPAAFRSFQPLYEVVRIARNDNMHTGAYARHATSAAIELCIGLEDALMAPVELTVGSVMVRFPSTVEPWQMVSQARQLMLTHSFSFLPVMLGHRWHLLSEIGLAKFLQTDRQRRLAMSIETASNEAIQGPDALVLSLVDPKVQLTPDLLIKDLLQQTSASCGPTLWLVVNQEPEQGASRLVGVLSPFELM